MSAHPGDDVPPGGQAFLTELIAAMTSFQEELKDWLREGLREGGAEELRRRHREGMGAAEAVLSETRETVLSWQGGDMCRPRLTVLQSVPPLPRLQETIVAAVERFLAPRNGCPPRRARAYARDALTAIGDVLAERVEEEDAATAPVQDVLEWLQAAPRNQRAFARQILEASDRASRERGIDQIARQIGVKKDTVAFVARKITADLRKDRGLEPDPEDVMAELRELHHRVHQVEDLPVTEEQRAAHQALTGIRRVGLDLIRQGTDPGVLETALLRHWVRSTTWNHHLDEEVYRRWVADPRSIGEPLLTMLKKALPALVDDGPPPLMRELGERVEQLRSFLGPRRVLPAVEAEAQAARADEALGPLIVDWHNRGVSPGTIESTLLYFWLRLAIIPAAIPEELFQRAERHFEEVMKCVGALVEQEARRARGDA